MQKPSYRNGAGSSATSLTLHLGSPDEDRLQAYAGALRDEYQVVVAATKPDEIEDDFIASN